MPHKSKPRQLSLFEGNKDKKKNKEPKVIDINKYRMKDIEDRFNSLTEDMM